MANERRCGNCKYRRFAAFGGYDYCMDYEMSDNTVKTAAECPRYEKEDEEETEYCPSSTAGDYSPSCPWNAPGMSIRDFI